VCTGCGLTAAMVNYMDDKIGLMVTALKNSTTKAPNNLHIYIHTCAGSNICRLLGAFDNLPHRAFEFCVTYSLNIFYIMIFCRDRLERTIIH
jgi:hypothetical protein